MDWRHISEMQGAGDAAFGTMLNLCVWAKTNGGMGSLYRSQHEEVFVFRKGRQSHRNNVQLGKFGRNRTNPVDISRRQRVPQRAHGGIAGTSDGQTRGHDPRRDPRCIEAWGHRA